MNEKEKLQETIIKALQEDTMNILGLDYRDKEFCDKNKYEELKSVIKNDLQNIRKELKIKNSVRYKTKIIELNDGTLYGEEFIGMLSLTDYEGTYPEEQNILNKYGYSLNNIGSSGVVSTTYGYNKNHPEINVKEINNGEALYTVFYASVLCKYDELNNLREDKPLSINSLKNTQIELDKNSAWYDVFTDVSRVLGNYSSNCTKVWTPHPEFKNILGLNYKFDDVVFGIWFNEKCELVKTTVKCSGICDINSQAFNFINDIKTKF